MTKVITYGLLHQGQINLLRRAKELGDYLIVDVTPDSFDWNGGSSSRLNTAPLDSPDASFQCRIPSKIS